MNNPSTSCTSPAGFVAAAKRALQQLREKGDGEEFSALCRDLELKQSELFAALCLPALDPEQRQSWMDLSGLACRPSFRWGGLGIRVREVSALVPLLKWRDPAALQIRALRLEGADAACVLELIEAGLCDGLRELVLEGCGVAGRGSAYPVNDQVVQVHMEGNEKLFEALSELSELRVLRIPENRLGNRGLALLRGLEHLEGLELRGNAISDRGLEFLSRFASLKRLGLSHNRIQGPGLAHLAHSISLRHLELHANPLEELAVQDLASRLPLCEIRAD